MDVIVCRFPFHSGHWNRFHLPLEAQKHFRILENPPEIDESSVYVIDNFRDSLVWQAPILGIVRVACEQNRSAATKGLDVMDVPRHQLNDSLRQIKLSAMPLQWKIHVINPRYYFETEEKPYLNQSRFRYYVNIEINKNS
jgi:hypothetical protein